MDEVRLAFVGVGSMGQAAHLRNYLTLPACRVVAIAEKRPELAARVAERYGIEKFYADADEMLERETVDGIVAIQPFELHVRTVPALLRYRVPVLTEKPLAATVAEGETICSAVAGAGAPLYLAYHKRSDPAVRYAKQRMAEWIESGEAGRLRYIRLTMPPGDWSVQAFASNIQTAETYDTGLPPGEWSEYGAFVNYYIHQVNLMRFLLGDDYEVLASDPNGVTMMVRSHGGVSGTLEMAPYSTSEDWQESALVCFERGWIRVELPAPMVIDQPGRVEVFWEGANGPQTVRPVLPPWHAMRCQAANLLAAIRGGAHPLCSATEGLKDLRTAQQYIESRQRSEAG